MRRFRRSVRRRTARRRQSFDADDAKAGDACLCSQVDAQVARIEDAMTMTPMSKFVMWKPIARAFSSAGVDLMIAVRNRSSTVRQYR